MSDHPTPATPEATEREAREVMERTLMRYAEIEHPNRDHPALTWKFERDVEADRADLDAYRAAVAAVEYERGRRAEREARGGQHAAYTFAPADPALALALDSAEKLAREADEKFCAAFGGDGETSAYWLGEAVRAIRVALHRQTTEERA